MSNPECLSPRDSIKKPKIAKVIDLPKRFEKLSREEQDLARTLWIRAKAIEWLEQIGESISIDKAVIVLKTSDGQIRWKSLMSEGFDDTASMLEKAKFNVYQTEFFREM